MKTSRPVCANVAQIKGAYRDIVEHSLRALASASGTLVIDAADIVNENTIKKYAPELSLFDLDMVKPVTAFQLKWFVEEELGKWVKNNKINTVMMFGLKSLFFDRNILGNEYKDLLESVLDGVRAKVNEVGSGALILTFSESFDNVRDAGVSEVLDSSSDVVFDLAELEVCTARTS